VSPNSRAVEKISGNYLIHDHAYENENQKADCLAYQLIHLVDEFKKLFHEPLTSIVKKYGI
jgi:hypothetical protein